MPFSRLGLPPLVVKGVRAAGYTEPTPIQQRAIPIVLAGRDLVGAAQTGTGKTAAFLLPILARLLEGNRALRALVLVPTRELAAQVETNARDYARFTNLRPGVAYGGVPIGPQERMLRNEGVDLLVATPGRLLDLHGRQSVTFEDIEILVLDEADRMVDMGFAPDLKRILRLLPRDRQTMMFSATMPPALNDVAREALVDPVRLDLAGGWTDTPPYCLEYGGKVLNVAVDVNGQPPIQVFAKLCERPELVVRSIDLGMEEHIRNYAELDTFAAPGNAFALAKAAFALAGFLPRFHGNGGYRSLEAQLRDFGGGIEVSLLSAVPKGSGLGTSSILAATVLAAIGDLCGLAWDRNILFGRTLALEQMLTTGGGRQDQAGAIFRGIKLIETAPGLVQKPSVRWLPHHLFDRDYANRVILLYYTGITRLAKNILGEIVRGIFLNSPAHLEIIGEIGGNAEFAGAAIQKCDYAMLVTAIQNSWGLNQRLDSGTNPVPVQQILERVKDYTAAAKLLGAGGGGYLLLFAKDVEAGMRIRQTLMANPPNARARFVDFALSETGLQMTRS
jgi:galactokinase/mevalonate kinase-like predicted kinase